MTDQKPASDTPRSPTPAPSGEPLGTVLTTAPQADDRAWRRFLDQLRSRGPTWQRYVLQGEVARGGMGIVQRVFDQDGRRVLAMKVILDPAASAAAPAALAAGPDDAVTLGRFLEEAQVTSQLDHPGIVPVHEIGVDGQGRVYFTMKLVKGEEFRRVLERVKQGDPHWTRTRALGVLLKVCEAMSYAHAKGVIHRDLKPGNVMVGRYGETYVMDWGLARLVGHGEQPAAADEPATFVRSHLRGDAPDSPPLHTVAGSVMGTPQYMPPEQAAGRVAELGPRSDVYSVGAMLYELVALQRPYQQPGERVPAEVLVERVVHGPPEPVADLAPDAPAELVAIIETAMARDLGARYASMTALADDLRAYLENRVVKAYETGAIAELKKWVRRNRPLALALAGAIVVASGAGFGLAWQQKNAALRIARERQVALDNEQTARREQARADQNAALARERLDSVTRLADARRLALLLEEMDRLWPAVPALAPALQDWLDRAEDLAGRLPLHVQTLAELRSTATRGVHPLQAELDALRAQDRADAQAGRAPPQARAGAIAALEARIAAEPAYAFADVEGAWWHETLDRLCADLRAFTAEDPFQPTIANVRARLARAESIELESIVDRRAEWDEAVRAIADSAACPAYGGLALAPQLGLVPLGRNEQSGLYEFWHVATGERPRRLPSGALEIGDDTGLVFVLIPGGTVTVGSQRLDPDAAQYDPQAQDTEGDAEGRTVQVALEPYFISKYEMTQGQWLRATGSNPSQYFPGAAWVQFAITFHHPVEQVNWFDCQTALFRLGLVLPTEAQWERAARAGTSSIWFFGDDRGELDDYGNVADRFAREHGGEVWNCDLALDDGFAGYGPVGSFRPNAFGLHDTIGNVWEWCRDVFGPYTVPARAGDGLREFADTPRTIRGGAFNDPPVFTRAAFRTGSPPATRNVPMGVRPARTIDR